MRLRVGIVIVAAAGLVACAGITGLSDYQVVPDDAGASKGEGGTSSGGPVVSNGVEISAPTFTSGGCGTTQTATLHLHNTTNAPVGYNITLADASTFSVGADKNGTVPALGDVDVTITATSAAPGTTTAPLIVSTGGAPTVLHLSYRVDAVSLSFAAPTLAIGNVRAGVTSFPVDVAIRNDGDSSVTLAGFDGSPDFALSSSGPPATLRPNATTTVSLVVVSAATTPPTVGDVTGTLTPRLSAGAFCGAPPTLSVTATRVTSDQILTPSVVDFGTVYCGQNGGGAAQKATLLNYGTSANTISVSALTHFTATPSTASVIAPATSSAHPGTVGFSFAPATVGTTIGDLSDTFNVMIGNNVTLSTKLHAKTSGGILTIKTPSVAITAATFGDAEGTATIQNDGDVTMCVRPTFSDADEFDFDVERDSVKLPPGVPTSFQVDYFGIPTGSHTATLSFKSTACAGTNIGLCNTPGTIAVSVAPKAP